MFSNNFTKKNNSAFSTHLENYAYSFAALYLHNLYTQEKSGQQASLPTCPLQKE